jgi:hypothetical protein
MGEPRIVVPAGKKVSLEITPLSSPLSLEGRMQGICAAEATPGACSTLVSPFLRTGDGKDPLLGSLEDLVSMELAMREAALAGNETFLLGLQATPATEGSSGGLTPFLSGYGDSGPSGLIPSIPRGLGAYQLTSFPISRFNGIQLPAGSRIRFADPARWFARGLESRLISVSIKGRPGKFFAWDAHMPEGKVSHDFYHANQEGMFNVFKQSNHSPLTGTALVQARQLRYIKIGGRVFLVVGAVIDAVQLGAAAAESYETGSMRPVGKQAVRTATGWAAAWAGAKAGVAVGALAGVETGPGVVLTAIGGGVVGGIAGYFGGNWIADWLFDD